MTCRARGGGGGVGREERVLPETKTSQQATECEGVSKGDGCNIIVIAADDDPSPIQCTIEY